MAAPDFAAQNLFAETVESLRETRVAPSRSRIAASIIIGETTADLLTGVAGFAAASLLYNSLSGAQPTQHSWNQIFSIGFCFGILFTFLRHRDGGYPRDAGILQIRETERNIRVALQSLALTQIFSILVHLHLPIFVTLIAAITVPAMLVMQKRAFFLGSHLASREIPGGSSRTYLWRRRDGQKHRIRSSGLAEVGLNANRND